MPDALPAVTTPSFLNAVGSLAIDSRLASRRACSSAANWVTPLRVLSSTGVSSAAKRPASCAAAQPCWLRRPYASQSSREILYFSARFSAVMAIAQPAKGSNSEDHSVSSSLPS